MHLWIKEHSERDVTKPHVKYHLVLLGAVTGGIRTTLLVSSWKVFIYWQQNPWNVIPSETFLSASVPTSSGARVSTFLLLAELLRWKPFPFRAMLGFLSVKSKQSYFPFQSARWDTSGAGDLLSRAGSVAEGINRLSLKLKREKNSNLHLIIARTDLPGDLWSIYSGWTEERSNPKSLCSRKKAERQQDGHRGSYKRELLWGVNKKYILLGKDSAKWLGRHSRSGSKPLHVLGAWLSSAAWGRNDRDAHAWGLAWPGGEIQEEMQCYQESLSCPALPLRSVPFPASPHKWACG